MGDGQTGIEPQKSVKINEGAEERRQQERVYRIALDPVQTLSGGDGYSLAHEERQW